MSYIFRQTHKYLSTTFREKDLQVIPALEDKFCNFYSGMDFEPYLGTFRQLVANKEYHTGTNLSKTLTGLTLFLGRFRRKVLKLIYRNNHRQRNSLGVH